MLAQYAITRYVAQAEELKSPKPQEEWITSELSERFGKELLRYLYPLVHRLQTANKMDKRPLKTLVQVVEAILVFRDEAHGLLLSELGDYLDQLHGGGGGTKRLETLIGHDKWKARQIEEFLFWRAQQQLEEWETQGEDGLLIWDATMLEKPESLKGEGLCPVRSSKAGRLTHVKKGYYRPPGAPIFVPGLHGIEMVDGRVGPLASYEKDEHCKLLRLAVELFGRRVVQVFDRGYCGGPWLGALFCFDVRFVLRWKQRYHLIDPQGVREGSLENPVRPQGSGSTHHLRRSSSSQCAWQCALLQGDSS
jgi:hypothetical protein